MRATGSSSTTVDQNVGAELLGRFEPAAARSIAMTWLGAEQLGAEDRGEPDRAGAHDSHGVAGRTAR